MTIATHICYTIEEAAEALHLSETVLVRLSQFFRVPATAYEDVGSLSFKDDPLFYEPDLTFFKEVKQRLVAGETLESLKKNPPRLQRTFPQPREPQMGHQPHRSDRLATPPLRRGTPLANNLAALNQANRQSATGQGPQGVQLHQPPELKEIAADGEVLSKTADRRFKQYKKQHGFGLKKVFQKLLSDLGMNEAEGVEDYDMLQPPPAPPQHSESQVDHQVPNEEAYSQATTAPAPSYAQVAATMSPEERETTWYESHSQASRAAEGEPVLYSPPAASTKQLYAERELDERLGQAARYLKEQALQRYR